MGVEILHINIFRKSLKIFFFKNHLAKKFKKRELVWKLSQVGYILVCRMGPQQGVGRNCTARVNSSLPK